MRKAMERIHVDLAAGEYEGLARFSEQELRSMGEQARHLIRQALLRRGLLDKPTSKRPTVPAPHAAEVVG
jgi:hypothetical protein